MNYRSIDEINDEINSIVDILNPMQEYLIENPDDISMDGNLLTLKVKLEELKRERGFVLDNMNLTTFSTKISHDDGSKVNLSSLGMFINVFEGLLRLCSIYDGKPIMDVSNFDRELMKSIDLKVCDMTIGSIDFTFSSESTNFSLNSHLKNGLKIFNEIIDCDDDYEKIEDIVNKIGTKPILMYKELLSVLYSQNLDLILYGSVGSSDFNTRNITAINAKKIYDVINNSVKRKTEILAIEGFIYTINMDSNYIGVRCIDSDSNNVEKYIVKFDEKFKEQLKNNIGNCFNFNIEKIIYFNEIDGEKVFDYNLVAIL